MRIHGSCIILVIAPIILGVVAYNGSAGELVSNSNDARPRNSKAAKADAIAEEPRRVRVWRVDGFLNAEVDPDRFNVANLLKDSSRSTQSEEVTDGFPVGDWVDSSENRCTIDRLLSSQRIPYELMEIDADWRCPSPGLLVVVPNGRMGDALSLLVAARRAEYLRPRKD